MFILRRQLHTTRWLGQFSLDSAGLSQRLDHVLSKDQVSKEDTLKALQDCVRLEHQFEQSSRPDSNISQQAPEKAHQLLDRVLESKNVKLDKGILHEFFVTSPPPSANASIKVMKRFQRQTGSAIPKQISMIPFRRAIYNADFPTAFAVVDAAVNSFQYKQMIKRQWYKFGALWTVGTGTILSGVELLLQSGLVGTWESTSMVHMMVLTYLASITVYSGLAFGGRISGNGEVLRWIQGTITTQQFSHAAEMKMCSLIADINRSLPENQGECSFKMRQDLHERNMTTVELEDEALLKEYWAKGGEGFEWVEPDQDPAEQLWTEKMDKSRAKRIGSMYSQQPNENYEWADQVVRETLPHASLVDMDNKKLLN